MATGLSNEEKLAEAVSNNSYPCYTQIKQSYTTFQISNFLL